MPPLEWGCWLGSSPNTSSLFCVVLGFERSPVRSVCSVALKGISRCRFCSTMAPIWHQARTEIGHHGVNVTPPHYISGNILSRAWWGSELWHATLSKGARHAGLTWGVLSMLFSVAGWLYMLCPGTAWEAEPTPSQGACSTLNSMDDLEAHCLQALLI